GGGRPASDISGQKTTEELSRALQEAYRDRIRRETAAAFEALAGDLDPGRAAEVAGWVVEQMAQTAFAKLSPGKSYPPGLPLTEVNDFKALTARLDRQQLADLLKNPFCVGPARDIVLQKLGRQVNRQFATVWDFVAWAEQHEPGLDLHTPP